MAKKFTVEENLAVAEFVNTVCDAVEIKREDQPGKVLTGHEVLNIVSTEYRKRFDG
jgi:hypothetical protein